MPHKSIRYFWMRKLQELAYPSNSLKKRKTNWRYKRHKLQWWHDRGVPTNSSNNNINKDLRDIVTLGEEGEEENEGRLVTWQKEEEDRLQQDDP